MAHDVREIQRPEPKARFFMLRLPGMDPLHHRLIAAAHVTMVALGGIPDQQNLHRPAWTPAAAQAFQCLQHIGFVIAGNDNDDPQRGMRGRIR